jgi:hypothetical protein
MGRHAGSEHVSFNRKSHAHAPNATYVRKDAAQWKKRGWTPTPNSLVRDPDLPPAVCWAWTWLASHTDEFEVSGLVLWKANNHLGRNRAYELLSELERRGLLLRRHEVDEHGVPYQIYDLQPVPVPEDERTWTPSKAVGKRGPHPQREARMQGQKQALTEVPNGPVLGAESGQSEVIHNPQVTPGFPVGRETVATCGNVDAEGGIQPHGVRRQQRRRCWAPISGPYR